MSKIVLNMPIKYKMPLNEQYDILLSTLKGWKDYVPKTNQTFKQMLINEDLSEEAKQLLRIKANQIRQERKENMPKKKTIR